MQAILCRGVYDVFLLQQQNVNLDFKGGTALVGEHGAELIHMPSGSKVTPADKTKQILKSGNPIAINITVQGNMIGNEQYANQLGNIIIQKIMTAQYNV